MMDQSRVSYARKTTPQKRALVNESTMSFSQDVELTKQKLALETHFKEII